MLVTATIDALFFGIGFVVVTLNFANFEGFVTGDGLFVLETDRTVELLTGAGIKNCKS